MHAITLLCPSAEGLTKLQSAPAMQLMLEVRSAAEGCSKKGFTCVDVSSQVDCNARTLRAGFSFLQILYAQTFLSDEVEQVQPLSLLDAPEHILLLQVHRTDVTSLINSTTG